MRLIASPFSAQLRVTLCSSRPHRAAWSREQARDYLSRESGRQFDPAVVLAFLQLEASGDWNPA